MAKEIDIESDANGFIDEIAEMLKAAQALFQAGRSGEALKRCDEILEKSSNPHFPSIVDIQCGEKAILL